MSFVNGWTSSLIQLKEIENILGELGTTEDRSILLLGDLNADTSSDTYLKLIAENYTSAYSKVNGREPVITHRNHRSEDVLSDFIFYFNKSSLDTLMLHPTSANLLPAGGTDEQWDENFTISDHRPIFVSFLCAITKPQN